MSSPASAASLPLRRGRSFRLWHGVPAPRPRPSRVLRAEGARMPGCTRTRRKAAPAPRLHAPNLLRGKPSDLCTTGMAAGEGLEPGGVVRLHHVCGRARGASGRRTVLTPASPPCLLSGAPYSMHSWPWRDGSRSGMRPWRRLLPDVAAAPAGPATVVLLPVELTWHS